MEVADVRRRVKAAIERAKRAAAERRVMSDEAAADYAVLLDRMAVPLFRQLGNVLRAEKHPFSVFTPAGGVRLTSDRSKEAYIELLLDTTGPRPQLIVHSSRGRGRRILESESVVADGRPVRDVTEEDLFSAVLAAIEPLVER